MAFPVSLPSYASSNNSMTLATLGHLARHQTMEADIVSLATKVGVDGSAAVTTHDYKLSLVTSSSKAETNANKDTDTALTANSDTKYPSQKATKAYVDALSSAVTAAIAAAKAALYPIGSIYTNASDSTNPGTLLGFGTWSAFAIGQVPVGKAASGTFGTIGATGGTETETLTLSQIPNATGVITMHNQAQYTNIGGVSGVFSSGGTNGQYGVPGLSGNVSSIGVINFSLGGGGGSHNNLQPYIVVYMWKRTA